MSIDENLTPLEQYPNYEKTLVLGEYSVKDYHASISGEGPRSFDWSDKPHRLVYDLCRALLNRDLADQMQPAVKPTYAELEVEFETLIGDYWDIAFVESECGGHRSKSANDTLHKLRALLRRAIG